MGVPEMPGSFPAPPVKGVGIAFGGVAASEKTFTGPTVKGIGIRAFSLLSVGGGPVGLITMPRVVETMSMALFTSPLDLPGPAPPPGAVIIMPRSVETPCMAVFASLMLGPTVPPLLTAIPARPPFWSVGRGFEFSFPPVEGEEPVRPASRGPRMGFTSPTVEGEEPGAFPAARVGDSRTWTPGDVSLLPAPVVWPLKMSVKVFPVGSEGSAANVAARPCRKVKTSRMSTSPPVGGVAARSSLTDPK